MIKKISRIIALMLVSSAISASPLVFQFHSPSFNGVGTSSHYLTIENLEKSRKDAIIAKAEAEERRLENERYHGVPLAKRDGVSFFAAKKINQGAINASVGDNEAPAKSYNL